MVLGGEVGGGCGVICIPYHSKVSFGGVSPPAVDCILLRQLGEAVQKCPDSLHIFICTKMMLLLWGKLLYKVKYLVLYTPPGGRGGRGCLASMHDYFSIKTSYS